MRFSCGRSPSAASRLLDRASAPEVHDGFPDERDSSGKFAHDERRGNAKYVVTETPEISIAPSVGGLLADMDEAIHFHNKPDGGAEEVRDVALPKHDLPAKRDPETPPAELPPERELRLLSVEPHIPSTSGEQVLASRRNGARRFEHGDPSARHGARAQRRERRLRDGEEWRCDAS